MRSKKGKKGMNGKGKGKKNVNTLQCKILEMDSLLEQAKDNRHCVTCAN